MLVVAGRPVVRRAAALFVAVGIPSSFVFAPNGLRARDLLVTMHGSLGLRTALWLGWLLLAAPALAVLVDAPGTTTLRSLGLPRGPTVAALAGLAAFVELPWMLLHARGGWLVAAWGAVTMAIAIGVAVRAARWLVVPGLAVVLLDASPWWAAGVGTVLAPLVLARAWSTPRTEGEPRRAHGVRRSRPVLALTRMHLRALLRAGPSRLAFAVIVMAIGGAGLLTLRSDPTAEPTRRALAIMAVPSVLVAALGTAPVLASERAAGLVLRSLRVPRLTILAAFVLAIVTPTTALAATASATAAMLCHERALPITTAVVAWSAGLGGLAGAWGRRYEPRGNTAAAFAFGVVLLALVASLLVLR